MDLGRSQDVAYYKLMKFKATENIKLHSTPSLDSPKVGSVSAGMIVEGEEHSWKAIKLLDGTEGFCAAEFLQEVTDIPVTTVIQEGWFVPIRSDKFILTQKFLEPDAVTYPKTGHHPGSDYGTQGEDNIPLFFCTDGEVIESGLHTQFGNYFFYYASQVDRTFVYFHLRNAAPAKGLYKGGVQCGITGQTGKSKGIHLHLECMKGKKNSANRSALYTSKDALAEAAEDADVFLRSRLRSVL